jgi:N-formylglutamate amidohydrolase
VIAVAEEVAAQFGWSLRHDDPYRGGYTTAQYGHPSQGIHAIQIELSRGRYLDEQRLTLLPHWVQTRQLCSELVLHLSRLSAASLTATSAKTPG